MQRNQTIVIDYEEYCSEHDCYPERIFARAERFTKDDLELREDLLVTCKKKIRAFSLTRGKWTQFDLIGVHELKYTREAFESLVLPQSVKLLLSSMVREKVDAETRFDDVIGGKGKGLILLLHGEPGTGKTLTAGKLQHGCR